MCLSRWQYLSSSKSFIQCTVGTWSSSDDFTHSWIISAVRLKQGTIVWDDPIETLKKKFLKANSSRAEKDLSYRRAQAGAQPVLVGAPGSGAEPAGVQPARARRWTWAGLHKPRQTSPRLSRDCCINIVFLKKELNNFFFLLILLTVL